VARSKASSGPKTLQVRVTSDGTRLDATPDQHTFSARWIERSIGSGLARVTVELRPDQGEPVVYELTGFERIMGDDNKPVLDDSGAERINFTAWAAKKSGG
jgi:hypothetical protein